MVITKHQIITITIIGLVILGIIWFSYNGELQNKLFLNALLNQSECDGEAITYTFYAYNDSVIYVEGIDIPIGQYNLDYFKATFEECEEVRVYCGNADDVIDTDGTPKIEPSHIFIAESSNSEIVDCFADSCIYQKSNSMEVCS